MSGPLVKPQFLRVNGEFRPLAVAGVPRLSWRVLEAPVGWRQTAYEIRVAFQLGQVESQPLWTSGRIESEKSFEIAYAGPTVPPSEDAYWQVRVWDGDGNPSEWSEIGQWAAALAGHWQWHAKWVSAQGNSIKRGQVLAFASDFELPDKPRLRSRMHLSAKGLIRAWVNDHLVTQERFVPGWTDYGRRIGYRAYDLEHLLIEGSNNVRIEVAPGWYSGQLCWFGTQHYGSAPAGLCRVCVEYSDQPPVLCLSGKDWRADSRGLVVSDLIQGEHANFGTTIHDESWEIVEFPLGTAKLMPLECLLPSVVSEHSPQQIIEQSDGVILDFGQNFVGVVQLPLGDDSYDITIRHAETLDAEGNLYLANLRSAKQEDSLVGAPGGPWSPQYTAHGFRYAKITSRGAKVEPADCWLLKISSVCVSSAFSCSDSRLNQLWENIVRSMEGNFLAVPTDCPQRDERLGWLGDILVFAPTAIILGDVQPFLRDWLWSVLDGQSDDGIFPNVAPQMHELGDGAPGWADAGVFVPYDLYQGYGDTDILRRCLPAMSRYCDALMSNNPNGLWENRRSHDFGDWLAVGEETDKLLIASAFMAESIRRTAEVAGVLQRSELAERYASAWQRCCAAFVQEFWDGARLSCDTQTAYALALALDLLPEAERLKAAHALTERIRAMHGRISCGFLGVSFLLPVLRRFGFGDVAMDLLLSEEFPSWLYPVKHGATSIWERWDGWTPEGGSQDPGMNSFNHYAFGSVGQFMMESVVGLRGLEPGRQTMVFSPLRQYRLQSASGALQTPVGTFFTSWKRTPGHFEAKLIVPPNGFLELSLEVEPTEAIELLDSKGNRTSIGPGHRLGSGTWKVISSDNG